ncbi:hypothetical protein E1B28_001828 [Marasmius oreades]|nr:uncharacterized protein E1B28_001828 [Marasmius oreades]KAG7100043.1 hypothetical protein E1B28_001828 [Marasmius oreades]
MIQTLQLNETIAKLAQTTKGFQKAHSRAVSHAYVGPILSFNFTDVSGAPLQAVQWFFVGHDDKVDFKTPFLKHAADGVINQTFVTMPNMSLALDAPRGLYTQTLITSIPSSVNRTQLEHDSFLLAKSTLEDGKAYSSTYGYGDNDEYVVLSGYRNPAQFVSWVTGLNETYKAIFDRWTSSFADVPPPHFYTNFVQVPLL